MTRITPKQLHVQLLMDSMNEYNPEMSPDTVLLWNSFLGVYKMQHGRYLGTFLSRALRVTLEHKEGVELEVVDMSLLASIRFADICNGLRDLFDQIISEEVFLNSPDNSTSLDKVSNLGICWTLARMISPSVVADVKKRSQGQDKIRMSDLGNLAFYMNAEFRKEYCRARSK